MRQVPFSLSFSLHPFYPAIQLSRPSSSVTLELKAVQRKTDELQRVHTLVQVAALGSIISRCLLLLLLLVFFFFLFLFSLLLRSWLFIYFIPS